MSCCSLDFPYHVWFLRYLIKSANCLLSENQTQAHFSNFLNKPLKVVPDEALLRQDSLRQDSLKLWSNVWHIVRPVSSARAPKTGARLTEARALALLPHWGKSARAPVKNLLKTTWSLEFNFHSLDGQIDLNPVYDEFDNRHFEFHQYTNCV